ncbi:MAG: hypothetical protein SVG88_05265 [Halobacteriales archaeon]|nr:hypothetical protein [Halobacteriales archaeon]
MEIGGYEFNGPLTDVTGIPRDVSGVYVVLCLVDDEPHCCLDVGAANQVGERLRGHDRETCWQEHVHGDIAYCYRITSGTWDGTLEPNPLDAASEPRSEQAGLKSELKWKLDVACGHNPWQEIEDCWELYQAYEDEFGPRGTGEVT